MIDRLFRFQLSSLVLAAVVLSSCHGVRAELKRRGVAVEQDQLIEFAAAGDLEVVDLLIQAEIPISGRDSYGSTALMAAAEAGEVDVAKYLIDRGADPNLGARGSWETPLMLATVRNREEMVRLLIDSGASVGFRDQDSGVTPLMMAAVEGHRVISAELIAAGADVGTTDQTGWTALHHAVRKGHSRLATALVEAGADPQHQDQDGFTPLSLAKSRGQWRLVAQLEQEVDLTKEKARSAGVQNSPFAVPPGWEIVDPFDGRSRFWPQHATFKAGEDPPGSRRVLLRSSPGEEAQIFLIVGQAGVWWERFRNRIQEMEQDPNLEEKLILRVHGLQGVTLDLRRYRLVDTSRAERQTERILALGEVGEGRVFVLDAGGSPLADGIDQIESVIRDSRLLDALRAEQSS